MLLNSKYIVHDIKNYNYKFIRYSASNVSIHHFNTLGIFYFSFSSIFNNEKYYFFSWFRNNFLASLNL